MLDAVDHATTAPETSDDAPQSLQVPLEALEHGQCRWPEQTATADLCITYTFCGQPVMAVGIHAGRAAYCAHHRRIALQHTPKRRIGLRHAAKVLTRRNIKDGCFSTALCWPAYDIPITTHELSIIPIIN
jgi:hypothetical protein